MKSIAELDEIRIKTLNQLSIRCNEKGIKVVVAMATCGIAAGARPVMKAFIEEINQRNLNNVTVSITDCIGVCKLEPVVEILDKDGKKVTYVNMTPEKAQRVVLEHIVNGNVCTDLTIDARENV
ncbi:(2Fe-2S) ferredoxin domain-containing protein [Ruminiclostridium cellulolyticum]|uniref:Ferredoxin n=1 Tax=Ruminiclostridium cellulolyticum (strain ATCC 35319 / DSM 5812 / JCM 6584 / H10) TaxID=394503 RepID=B8I4S2_RUMCH|nr:(2Fe-2S) ferredoxin domain-containing protein [Ruminiclostridium cellulolyticum]ACL76576.1 ferredoxin [Ruminiclostridium cellulolyticum H10]